MGLMAKETGGGMKFDPVPEGVHVAVCYGVVDLGTHYSEIFQKSAHKVLLQWELPHCRGMFERDGRPMDLPRAISKRYTLSLHENSELRASLQAWLGRQLTAQELTGFDLRGLLGTACQLQVLHETKGEKTYGNITALMALPKGMTKPKLENSPAYFAFGDGQSVPLESLPQWVRDIIMESDEFKALGKDQPKPVAASPTQTQAKPSSVAAPVRKDADWFWDIICPVPRQGQTRADYLQDPQTIGSLYDGMKAGDDQDKRRLWGFAEKFEPKPWTGKDGKTRPPNAVDVQFREALDAFKIWHAAQPNEKSDAEDLRANAVGRDEDGTNYDDVPF